MKELFEFLTTEQIKIIDVEALEQNIPEAHDLASAELARRAIISEVAYDASDDGTATPVEHQDQRWI